MLAASGRYGDGEHAVNLEQGVEMGRPSLIRLTLTMRGGRLAGGHGRRRCRPGQRRDHRGVSDTQISDPQVIPFERFDLRLEPRPWPFADDNRTAIDARFAAKQKVNPALWNGRVLLAHEY